MQFGHTFELLDPAKGGHKTQTTRIPAQKWYDWYASVNMQPKITQATSADGRQSIPIAIKFCTVKKLGYVRDHDFWAEGFSSPAAFEAIWKEIHGSFNAELDVCVLEFDVRKAHIIYK